MGQVQDFGLASLVMFMELFDLMLTSSLDLFSMRLEQLLLFFVLASFFISTQDYN